MINLKINLNSQPLTPAISRLNFAQNGLGKGAKLYNRLFGFIAHFFKYQKTWSLDHLSMFLAVDKEILQLFLFSKQVTVNKQGHYQSKEIDRVLKSAKNSEINTTLEAYRTQQKSIRFAGD